jgi:restriction system protein
VDTVSPAWDRTFSALESAATLEEAEEAAWGEIREYLVAMRPYDFQELVGALLRAMGYYVLWEAPPGPDRGIDLIAYTDPLGTTSPRIKVQVKRQPDNKIADGHEHHERAVAHV